MLHRNTCNPGFSGRRINIGRYLRLHPSLFVYWFGFKIFDLLHRQTLSEKPSTQSSASGHLHSFAFV